MSYNTLPDVQKNCDLILDENSIKRSVEKVVDVVCAEYSKLNPICLVVMNGGLFFAADVLKGCDFRLTVDYVHASRYGNETIGSSLSWFATPKSDLTGRDILVLDDILDGGITLAGISNYCEAQGANSVRTAIFANKAIPRQSGGLESADIVGVDIPNRYVFGYGMDYQGAWRQLKEIYAIPEKQN